MLRFPLDPRIVAFVLAYVLPGSLGAPVAAAQDAPRKPNIVFILADDLGYGDLGCFGQKQVRTPNLDRMAAEGMRLTSFYAGSTVCAPSRSVLMTGLHLGHTFVRGNAKDNLPPGTITVAEVLEEAGYRTALIGKWGLGHEGSAGVPTRQGFDYFFGYLDQHHAHNYYPSFLVRNESRVPLRNVVPDEGEYGQGVADEKVEYSHDRIAEEALAFVDAAREAPFFLYWALTIPHANNEARREGMEVPSWGEYAERDWPAPQKGFAAMVTRMDADVGRLLARLKQQGIDEHTLVIFTSDNGPHREGGNDPDFFDSNGALRGIKRDLYEGGIRVPTIARWPGRIAAASESDLIAYFGDFLPTAADVAGVEPPYGLDGASFLPTLLGESERQQQHEYLYWEFFERGSAQAIRAGRWKAIANPFGSGAIELYDLEKDLGETEDVAAANPEVVARMRRWMAEAHVPSPYWPVSKRSETP